MMFLKARESKKGITLIEILVTIAILGIIVVAFGGAFVNGYSTVFAMGNKTKAMVSAQEAMDLAYKNGKTNINSSLTGISVDKTATDFSYSPSSTVQHKISTQNVVFPYGTVVFTKLTIRVYYQNGNREVDLTSYIP